MSYGTKNVKILNVTRPTQIRDWHLSYLISYLIFDRQTSVFDGQRNKVLNLLFLCINKVFRFACLINLIYNIYYIPTSKYTTKLRPTSGSNIQRSGTEI